MKFSRIFTLLCTLILSVTLVFAQSSGDKLYNQGLQLQKTMTVSAQNSAIAKFTSAKKLYDSAAKKAQCDQAISVSRNIIASLKGGGGTKGSSSSRNNTKQQETAPVKVEPTLLLSNSEFNVDLNSKALSVTVNTNQDSWTVTPVACEDGSSFLQANKLGTTGFEIIVPQNPSTIIRTQKVMVTAGDLKREVTVTQTGRNIELEVNNKSFTVKNKGEKKKLTVSCNSDYVYPQNSDENWYVESVPDWIKVTVNEKREKGFFAKLKDKGEELVMGKSVNDNDARMVKSEISVMVDPCKPGTIPQTQGRSGEIVLRSGDKTVTIYVTQKPDKLAN